MKKIGIGVIGYGSMGQAIVDRLPKISSQIEIKGVYEIDERSIEKAKTNYPDAVLYKSYEELVKNPDIDWVMIASWNCYHKEQVIAAFTAGKHVFCQKPLATTIEDCAAMLDAWKKSGKMFNLGFTLRYSPHYRKIKELLSKNAIGKIVSMEFNETLDFNHGGYIMGDWRRLTKYAGTHLHEKCCHDIDLVNWMMESSAKKVASFGGLNFFKPENSYYIEKLGKSKEGRNAYWTWKGLINENPFTSDKDVVDNQVAIIEYENGARATFHTNCNAGIPERRMYILGTDGAIRANVLTGTIELQKIGFETKIIDESTESKGGHGGGDDILAQELIDSMLKGIDPSVGLYEGVKSSVTCFAIDDAMNEGKVVSLEKYWEKVEL